MKLHIGGKESRDGWKLLNIQRGPDVDFVGDISNLARFGAASIDEIYASHVLEHVPQGSVDPTLAGIHRVLKPGGRFLVSVPDMDVLCRTFIDPALTLPVRFHVMRMMFGGQVDPDDFHCFGWNFEFMQDFLRRAGFGEVRKVEDFGLFNDASSFRPYGYPISLNVIAVK
ncbi:MAG TPA: methyltransferase domain-containing protein [Burkholderiales bacterium]|jgi:predicted SAM-dependent methyltransferase